MRRKIQLHAMKFINQPKLEIQSSIVKENSSPQRGYLTKDRKIKLDKIIKSGGFKEI